MMHGNTKIKCVWIVEIFLRHMSVSWNTGRSHDIKTDNSSFERVEQFKYLGTTLKDQNSVQEEIKSRLK